MKYLASTIKKQFLKWKIRKINNGVRVPLGIQSYDWTVISLAPPPCATTGRNKMLSRNDLRQAELVGVASLRK